MTPEVIAALQAMVGRALTTEEQAALAPLVAARNDVAIAALLSVGRVRVESRMLSERGVLSALGSEAGDAMLTALEGITSPDALPMPLRSNYGAIRRAVSWLKGDGVDVGDPLTRGMLDALAATGVIQVASAAAIKRLAERPDPLPFGSVSDALNKAQGLMTLGG